MYIELEYKILQLTTVRKCTLYNHDCSAQYTNTVSNVQCTLYYTSSKFYDNQILLIKISKSSLGTYKVPIKKIGPNQFSRFDLSWIQTNKQTNTQTNQQTNKVVYKVKL